MKLRTDDLDNLFATTLASALTDSALTIYLNSVPANASEGFLVIDPDDSSKREVIYFNAVGENYVSCPASGGRGQAGTSAVSHDSGAVVKMMFLREHWKPLRDAIYNGWLELNLSPEYASASSITIPTDLTSFFTEGRKLKITFESSGVKYFTIASSSYSSPDTTIELTGDTVVDESITSIEVDLSPKGYAAESQLDFSDLKAPQGFLINGKIVPSVDSNNLTVAIKTLAGEDPSEDDPVYVRIGDTIRSITSALSVTKNAGTNWFNAGSPELAAKEIDYFVYLGFNATDGVVIGFSRIPYANSYDDFSATSINEKFCAVSTTTNAAATDYYEVVGRFAAILSTGAGYTWSVPTFTAKNLIQRPIYETRWLTWTPILTGFSINPTTSSYSYKIIMNTLKLYAYQGGDGTSNGTGFTITTPFSKGTSNITTLFCAQARDNGAAVSTAPLAQVGIVNAYTITFYKDHTGSTSWTASNGKRIVFISGDYQI